VVTHFENADAGYGDDDAPDTGTDDYDPPTVAELSSFAATWCGDEVLVAWETTIEIDTAGFNVWRSATMDGGYVQINDELIRSAVPGGTRGGSYSLIDSGVTPGIDYYYKLEELEAGGGSNWYGPSATDQDAGDSGKGDTTVLTLAAFSARGPAVAWWSAATVMVLGLGLSGVAWRRRRS
jgi:hypothetical protein